MTPLTLWLDKYARHLIGSRAEEELIKIVKERSNEGSCNRQAEEQQSK